MGRFAILGTGRMGAALALRLRENDHQVTAWNRTAERAAPLAAHGVHIATTPADAVRDADVVVTLLADADAVDHALNGPNGAATAIAPTAILAQMSTIGPQATTALRDRLPDHVVMVDAPVKGSVPQIRAGSLVIFAAGAETAIDRLETAMSDVGSVRRCGEMPAASALKLVVNASMIATLAVLADVRHLAADLDLPADLVNETLAGGPLAPAMTRAAASGARFPIALAAKDLGLALQHSERLDVLAAARAALLTAPDQDSDLGTIVPTAPKGR
ncbi:NAD(P)-dependent oxidoreductase [Stackebrandtia soli]|uniref:NAD(P)-dependent oxidoreductase n=1 Tax=Stackebrandtia soli TaxID=1892856 RepID=UPI0039E9BA70